MSLEREAMRAYVTGADHLQYSWLADGMVQVNVTHSNLKQYTMEYRLPLSSTIASIKQKLYSVCGSSIAHMRLQLKDTDSGEAICMMDNDEAMLGYYSVKNGQTIHVIDTDPFSLSRDGGLDDVSQIEKYRMSDEDYDKREKTLRAYKRKMLEKDPTFKFLPENRRPARALVDYQAPECVAAIKVGDRCEVSPGARRGTVKFVGLVPQLLPGHWVGVKLDEPLGKGDGSRGGVKYFDADDKYGVFVRPDYLTVGDFPAEEIDGEAACACGHEEHHESKEEKMAPPATSAAQEATKKSAAAAEKKMNVGGMRRVGGMRDDEADDHDDDEL